MAKKRKSPDDASGLTPEDAKLWSRVTGSIEPLAERDIPVTPAPPKPQKRVSARRQPPGDDAWDETWEGTRDRAPASKPQIARPHERPGPPLGRIERRESRQIAGGRVVVDARIDLHGHRQREAYGALKDFLARSRAAGHRYVLVITGKGAVRAEDEAAPFYETQETGVLKRAVPRWLAEPGFRELIVSFGPAHIRHGGEGALYIRLRRDRGELMLAPLKARC
jgi:DNA-nicking Smr family endonuclease